MLTSSSVKRSGSILNASALINLHLEPRSGIALTVVNHWDWAPRAKSLREARRSNVTVLYLWPFVIEKALSWPGVYWCFVQDCMDIVFGMLSIGMW